MSAVAAPLLEISPLQLCEAMHGMSVSPVFLEFGADLLGLHAAYWLGTAGRSLGLLPGGERSTDDLLDAMEQVARSYARPFSRGHWRIKLSTAASLSLAARAASKRSGVLLALGGADPAAIAAAVHLALGVRAMIFRADMVRDAAALDAVARACNLELHALRLPAVVAPSSTRRSGLPGAPFLDAGEQRAARHRGIITVDQALLALSSLVARVAEGSGPCAPVTHVLEPTYRPDAVRIDALLAAEPEGEESPPRWPSHMTTPLMAHAPSGVPVATGIFADDLEVTLALAGPATGSIFRYRYVRADDGAALAVYDTDPAGTDRPAIVACNAFGMPAELLEPLARALAGRFRFITWQSRGVPVVCKVRPDELTIERQVQDLEAVLSHTRLQDCGLLGWCLGAQVALEAASRGAAVISSLVLLNGVFAYDEAPQTEWQKSLLKTTSYVLAAPDNAAKMCAFVYGAPKPRAANAPNAYAAATQRGDVVLGRMTSQPFRNAESLRRYAEFVTRAGQRQGCVDWDRLPPRTLFVAGHEDQVVTPQSIALASRRVPGARLLELPDTDHYGHYYEPERYAHLIEEIAAHDHRLQPAI